MKYLVRILFLIPLISYSQDSLMTDIIEQKLAVQLSGVLVTGDSLQAVSYANVYNPRLGKGTITDDSGFFSTVVTPGDTIIFSSIGYKTSIFTMPDTLNSKFYSLIHLMDMDTVYLDEITIRPWPTYEQFKNIFDDIEVPESDLDRAKENIEQIAKSDPSIIQTPDAELAYDYQMAQYRSKLYYIGQLPPNNLLNPLAWAEFVKAWKNGDFLND